MSLDTSAVDAEMPRWRSGCIALIVGALAGGCGGTDEKTGDGSSRESEARTAPADFLSAVLESDEVAACDRLTSDGQESLVKGINAIARHSAAAKNGSAPTHYPS